MEKKLCKLCQNVIADKTNSHILSHSLIKRAINYEGQNERDKELSFTISSQDFTSIFMGNQTLVPHILEKIYDKELSDSEIDKIVSENISNPFARDYILCTDCEKRLGVLESEFQSKVYNKLSSKLSFSNDLKLINRLFIYSLIWRMSIIKFNEFQLSSKIEEKLRKILDENLSDDKDKMMENANKNNDIICSFPLILTFLETIGDTTKNVIFVAKTNMPYFFIINDLSFEFYEKESHTRSTPSNFFDMHRFLNFKELINFKENNFKIGLLNDEQRKEILKNVYNLMAKNICEQILIFFRGVYKKCFYVKPNKNDDGLLLDKIINNDMLLLEKYSFKRIVDTIAEVIMQIQQKSWKKKEFN